jgi:hypothetical protein
VGVVRLSSTDSSKGNSSPAQIIAASPTALATATQVGVDGVYKEIKIELHETTWILELAFITQDFYGIYLIFLYFVRFLKFFSRFYSSVLFVMLFLHILYSAGERMNQ